MVDFAQPWEWRDFDLGCGFGLSEIVGVWGWVSSAVWSFVLSGPVPRMRFVYFTIRDFSIALAFWLFCGFFVLVACWTRLIAWLASSLIVVLVFFKPQVAVWPVSVAFAHHGAELISP